LAIFLWVLGFTNTETLTMLIMSKLQMSLTKVESEREREMEDVICCYHLQFCKAGALSESISNL